MASRLPPRARIAAAVAGWLAAAAVVTGAGMFAVGAIGDGIVPRAQQPKAPQEIEALANAPRNREPANGQAGATESPPAGAGTGTASPNTPTATQNPPARPPSRPKVLSTPGGTVLAKCAGQRVGIVSVSPAQGFQVDEDDDDGGSRTEVKFKSEETEIKVRLHCSGGVPRASIEREGDD